MIFIIIFLWYWVNFCIYNDESRTKCGESHPFETQFANFAYRSFHDNHYLLTNAYVTHTSFAQLILHDDAIKWKHFPRYWSFVRGIHRWPVDSPHKGQWRAAMLSLICAWTNGWATNQNACELRRHRAHYYVTVMGAGLNYTWMRSL